MCHACLWPILPNNLENNSKMWPFFNFLNNTRTLTTNAFTLALQFMSEHTLRVSFFLYLWIFFLSQSCQPRWYAITFNVHTLGHINPIIQENQGWRTHSFKTVGQWRWSVFICTQYDNWSQITEIMIKITPKATDIFLSFFGLTFTCIL